MLRAIGQCANSLLPCWVAHSVAGREDHLVVLVGVDGHVGEIEHRVGERRAVEELDRRFEVGPVRIERQPDEPLHAVPPLDLADPDGLAAVGVLLQRVIDRHEGGGAVVVGDVPLDAAGDPGAQHADQGGLDDVLAVEEVVAVGLVLRAEDAPAELRQDADLDVLVLQVDRLVGLVFADVRQLVEHRIGIDGPLRALVGPAAVEDGIPVRLADLVGGDHQRLFPGFDGRIALRERP